jgi:hypothetical protein
MLHKLLFDATDANTILASANVGAYLRASDGTLLTHTDVGGKKALDVRVAEGINVEVDLDQADDSVAIGDGTNLISLTASGEVKIVDNGNSITVDAVNLDIRDLAFATDSVTAYQGTSPWVVSATDLDIRDLAFATDSVDVSGSSVSISGSVAVTQSTSPWVIGDGGGSITVDAVNLDIRDLAAATDSVSSWLKDGSGNSITSTAGALNVNIASGTLSINDAALADTAMKANAETVGTSAVQVIDGADELASRKYVMLYNNGNRQAYVGPTGVTTSSGFPIPPGSMLEARIGAAVDIFMIADGANQNVRALQLS